MARVIRTVVMDVDDGNMYKAIDSDELAQPLALFTENHYIIRIQLRDLEHNAVDVSDVGEWQAAYGNYDEPLLYVYHSDFNIGPDWEDVDPNFGKICLRLDLDNIVDADLGTDGVKPQWLQVYGSDGEDTRTYCMIPINLMNTVADPDEVESSSSES
jgi:hypothetical protein